MPVASSTANPHNGSPIMTTLPQSASSVTLNHEDFEHLLKMAHGEPTMPSASFANVGNFVSVSTQNNS